MINCFLPLLTGCLLQGAKQAGIGSDGRRFNNHLKDWKEIVVAMGIVNVVHYKSRR
jgi:hypothetical protein